MLSTFNKIIQSCTLQEYIWSHVGYDSGHWPLHISFKGLPLIFAKAITEIVQNGVAGYWYADQYCYVHSLMWYDWMKNSAYCSESDDIRAMLCMNNALQSRLIFSFLAIWIIREYNNYNTDTCIWIIWEYNIFVCYY